MSDMPPRPRWHDEAHDGVLEYASLRFTAGSLNLFVNVGIELDGKWSARVEVLNDREEITGLAGPDVAKRAAIARARQLIAELHAQLAAFEDPPSGRDGHPPHGHEADPPHGHEADPPHGHEGDPPHGHEGGPPHGHEGHSPPGRKP